MFYIQYWVFKNNNGTYDIWKYNGNNHARPFKNGVSKKSAMRYNKEQVEKIEKDMLTSIK